MSSSAINLAGMQAPQQFRNKIINGNFDIWQRGITFGTHDDSLDYGPLANGLGATGSNGLANIGNGDTIKNNPYVSPVAQRGGAQADGNIIKDKAYTADRWRLMNRSGWKGHVVRKEFDWSDVDDLLPAGSSPARYYMEHSVEYEGNNSSMSQRIEDVTIFNNEKITVSFYARRVPTSERPDSNLNRMRAHLMAYTKCTGSNINSGDSSNSPDGSPLYNVNSNYQLYSDMGAEEVLTDDWKKFTYTFIIPQMAGKLDGNGNAVTPGEGFWVINLKPMTTAIDEDTGDGVPWLGAVHYAQVQVEKKDDTTEFELLPPGIELQRCQRYFQKSLNLENEPGATAAQINTAAGHIIDDAIESSVDASILIHMPGLMSIEYSSTGMSAPFRFHTPMRDTPEIFIYSVFGNRGWYGSQYVPNNGEQVTTDGYNEDTYPDGNAFNETKVRKISGISTTGWQHMHGANELLPYGGSDSTFYWTADAEL